MCFFVLFRTNSPVEMEPSDDKPFSKTSSQKRATNTLISIKVVELCLLICCLALIEEPAKNAHLGLITPRVLALCYVTFGSLAIYSAIYLIMALFGDLTPWRAATLWALVGFVLFIAVTSLLFVDSSNDDRDDWHPNMHHLDLVRAAASVSLVTAVIYLLDAALTIRFGVRSDLE